MDARSLANQLLDSFGRILTIDGLKLGEQDDGCVLLFDGDLALRIEYDEPSEQLMFSIYLASLPEERPERLLRELLGANLYWIGSGGATMCIDSASDAILLIQAQRVAELDDGRFERLVESLLNMAERWRERIAAHRTGASMANHAGAGSPALQSEPPVYG
jgi:Tir chaperone protein (CesT) family